MLRSDFFQAFEPVYDAFLDGLAAEYCRRTEAYDRTVCTGPIGRDGILPATPREMSLIGRNAFAIKKELEQRALENGYTAEQFRDVMRQYAKNPATFRQRGE